MTKIQRGFTLIELMIVVAIIVILALMAVYGYKNGIEKTRLADAKAALLQDGQFLERFYADNGHYGIPNNQIAPPALPKQSTAFYTISRSSKVASPTDGSGYLLVAIPNTAIASSSHYYLAMNQDAEVRRCDGVTEAANSLSCPIY